MVSKRFAVEVVTIDKIEAFAGQDAVEDSARDPECAHAPVGKRFVAVHSVKIGEDITVECHVVRDNREIADELGNPRVDVLPPRSVGNIDLADSVNRYIARSEVEQIIVGLDERCEDLFFLSPAVESDKAHSTRRAPLFVGSLEVNRNKRFHSDIHSSAHRIPQSQGRKFKPSHS